MESPYEEQNGVESHMKDEENVADQGPQSYQLSPTAQPQVEPLGCIFNGKLKHFGT